MDITALKTYSRTPHTADFPVGTEAFSVTFDKAAFTARLLNSLYEEMKARQEEVQAEIARLSKDLKVATEGGKDPDPELSARIMRLRVRIEDVEQEVYARALAEAVLISWGLTHDSVPVPISTEVLMSQPKEFVRDLFAFCRAQGLPKVAKKKRRGKKMMTPAISSSTTAEKSITPRPSALQS